MALNQRRNPSLLDAKIVPAVTDVCLRQALHWYKIRAPRLTMSVCDPRSGTRKTLRPAPPHQRRVTERIGSVHCVELVFAHAFLKLNFVARHEKSLQISSFLFV